MKKESKPKGRTSFSLSFDNTKLENVWDRVMTYGKKSKDGIEYDFNDAFFDKIISNFSNSKREKFGSDYEHQTMNAALNGKPAPNLAYYNAYAVIKNGKVRSFFSKDKDVKAPLVEGRADGLYAYRFKATPLGKQLIPNYDEISPLFDTDDTNERGEEIGPNINNISFVNVSHQEGTTVGFNKKGKQMKDKELYGMLGHEGDGEPSHEELKEHMKAFMTDKGFMDPKTGKGKTEMGDENEEKLEREAQAEKDKEAMKKSKMGISSVKEDEGSGKGKDDLVDDVKEDEDEMKELAQEQKKMMAKMSKQLAEANKKLADLSGASDAVTFAKRAVASGRWPADSMEKLVGFAKKGKGEAAIAPFEAGTFQVSALSKKIFNGGDPEGSTSFSATVSETNGYRQVGVSMSKAMKSYAKKNKIEFSHDNYRAIQLAVTEEHPELMAQYAAEVL